MLCISVAGELLLPSYCGMYAACVVLVRNIFKTSGLDVINIQ